MQNSLLKRTKSALIGDRSFYSKVFIILLPMIIQNTVTNFVSLLDNIMVGRIGTLQMTAVAIDNQLMFVFNLCIFGGLAGAGIFSAQYAGAKDDNGLRYCFRMKCYIGIFMLLCAVAIFTIFDSQLITAYLAKNTSAHDAKATLEFGKNYLLVMIFGLLPFTVSQIYSSTLRELGETKLPMISSLSAIILNLILNYLLIFGKFGFPKLHVVGAAIATVISRYAEAVIILIFAHSNSKRFGFINGLYSSFKIPLPLCKKILKSGSPLLINEFLWSMGMAMLLKCYSVRSLTVIAATNISNTAANLFNVAFLSMGGAIAIMLGQALGANNPKKAYNMVWKLLSLSVFLSVILGAALAFFAHIIPLIYNTEPEVRTMATQFLYIVAFLMPVFAFSHGCYFTMRSGGRTVITFLFDSAVVWLFNIPLAYFLSSHTNINIVIVFLIIQCIDILKCILGFILVKRGVWIRNIVS